ncbi:hypothetical protein HMPREF0731_1022, partial [Pseudoroseomonas cervicalis ATCC 49957]
AGAEQAAGGGAVAGRVAAGAQADARQGQEGKGGFAHGGVLGFGVSDVPQTRLAMQGCLCVTDCRLSRGPGDCKPRRPSLAGLNPAFDPGAGGAPG